MNNWKQKLVKAPEENQDDPIFEGSITSPSSPADDAKEVVKGIGEGRRLRWRRVEILLFAAPLLVLLLTLAPLAVTTVAPLTMTNVRTWSAPPKRNYATSGFKGDPKTDAERIQQERFLREQTRYNTIAEAQYQRRLAIWRLFFVVLPRVWPWVVLVLLVISGITVYGIRMWRQSAPRRLI